MEQKEYVDIYSKMTGTTIALMVTIDLLTSTCIAKHFAKTERADDLWSVIMDRIQSLEVKKSILNTIVEKNHAEFKLKYPCRYLFRILVKVFCHNAG